MLSRKAVTQQVANGIAIVLSILIAFGIDASWDQMKAKQEEKRILISFHNEFLANRSSLASVTLKCEDIKSAILTLLNEAATPESYLSKSLVDTLIGTCSWFINKSTIEMSASDAIIFGGKLSTISNENLRLKITEWNRDVGLVQLMETQDYDAFIDYWMPFLRKHANLSQISNAITVQPGTGEANYTTTVFSGIIPFDHSTLIKEREFQNVLLQRLWVMNDILYNYEQLRPKLESMIVMLASEIG